MVSLDTNETFNISTISTPNVSSHKGIDGFYEESEYIGNYTGEKAKTSSIVFIFTILMIIFSHGNNDIEIIDEKSTTEKKLKLIKLV